MRRGKLSIQQAINIAGLDKALAVEEKNCEPTNRLQTDGDPDMEWAASVNFRDCGGNLATLVIYYYTTEDDQKYIDDGGDWSDIDWAARIEGYEIQ